MGRLTDDLMAAFGVKPSDRVSTGLPASANAKSDTTTPSTVSDTDCVSCRVIGTSVLVAATGLVVFNTFRTARSIQGWKRGVYYAQSVCIASVLMTLAGCRAFNKGIFEHTKSDKTVFEEAKSDLKYMVLSLGYDLPTFLQDANEPPK